MSRRLPAALKVGDRVAIVSPASPFAREEFDHGLAELQRLGFVPVYDETVFAKEAGYLSGSAQLRADAFMRYWTDPDVAALVAARGGYGSAHLLPLLNRDDLSRVPKLFVAYSDNTALLSWLTCQCGLTALHGPMLERRLSRGATGYDESSFMSLLQGGRGLVLAPDGLLALREGEASGPLFGGTMTQLVSSFGTPYAFDPPDGCILFLEDVNERPYRVDRMLTQLAQSGTLARAVALVFGEMRGCNEERRQGVPGDREERRQVGPPERADEPALAGRVAQRRDVPGDREPVAAEAAGQSNQEVTVRAVIQRLTRDFRGPVLFGFPSGHTAGPCWTLPLGVQVRVTTRPHPSIVVEEPPVA